ncbi:MAG: AAA family ATPase [Polyangiaceae bacterium]
MLIEAHHEGAKGVSAIQETCSECAETFDVLFSYQMEERNDAFAFFCSQTCLSKSQRAEGQDDESVVCDACYKRFTVNLVSQVMYSGGKRNYACSLKCRTQIRRESEGLRLGEIAAEETAVEPSPILTVSNDLPAAGSQTDPASEEAGPGLAPLRPVPPPAAVKLSVAKHGLYADASRDDRLVVPEASSEASRTGGAVAVPFVPAIAGSSHGRLRPPAAPKANRGPRRIAVFNHKGGTGKTTTSVNLAAGLADRGHRVLLVDTDSQGNVGVSLGAKCDRTLYHVLVMGLRVRDAIHTVREGLDLLPSNETLAAAELYLAGRKNRDRVLSERMEDAASDYDYVIIDCSPSLSLMNQNALCFADSVLVPVACDYLSLVGVRQVIKTVKNVNTLLRHPLKIWGVLPTFYDGRAKICQEALETLQGHFGERCLQPIRATIKLKEAPAQERSIFEHAPGTYGDEDYSALVDGVLAAASTSTSTPNHVVARGA